jgi:hypothetical protein
MSSVTRDDWDRALFTSDSQSQVAVFEKMR